MEWISGWIQGIIVAVIISTIIEMILPEGTSKKYIKMVIGVYILFTIISPIVNKITGNNFALSSIFDLDEYIEASKSNVDLQNELNSQNQNQIKNIYVTSMKNDIKEKVESKGYRVNNIMIELQNYETYAINKIKLQVSKEKLNEEILKEVSIDTSKQVKDENHDISNKEKTELKDYLSSVYEVNKIFINE